MKTLSELGISKAPWGTYQTKKEVAVTTSVEGFGDLESALCRGPNRKSNATLIQAAPDMYKAGYDLVNAFDRRELMPEHINAMRAALAKASGLISNQEG